MKFEDIKSPIIEHEGKKYKRYHGIFLDEENKVYESPGKGINTAKIQAEIDDRKALGKEQNNIKDVLEENKKLKKENEELKKEIIKLTVHTPDPSSREHTPDPSDRGEKVDIEENKKEKKK